MQYLLVVQRLQAPCDIHQSLPNFRLLDASPSLEVLVDALHEIASGCELHDDAEVAGLVIVECLAEADDVVVADRSQDPDLIQRVFFLLLLHSRHPHLLQCVDLVVEFATHLVHLSECTLPDLFYHFEVF